MELVSFYDQKCFEVNAEKLYLSQKEVINRLIPNTDVQHVGSTAIPNSLTNGDLDIQIRVSKKQFIPAVEALSAIYDTNEGSAKTNEFRAFKDDTMTPALGIQLTVIDSKYDFFWKFRDVLLQIKQLRIEYDELKINFEGKSMEAYRDTKDDLFSKMMQTPEFKELMNNINNK